MLADTRLDYLRSQLGWRFDQVDRRFDWTERHVDRRFDEIRRQLDRIERRSIECSSERG